MHALVLTLIQLLVGCAAQGPLTYRPAQTSPQQPLLGKSKTRGKASIHTTFEGQKNRGHASDETHAYDARD